ncbi:MAG TPA: hypothetical protein VFC00_28085 [Micromonosporaceae bacterium]|nr:hypothetical protein [Micromonosporaceae bacterium]
MPSGRSTQRRRRASTGGRSHVGARVAGPSAAARIAVASAAATAGATAVLAGTRLLTRRPVGTADNTDGIRLYCGVGLVPATADRRADWKGGVVVHFTRDGPCTDPIPSAALLILKGAAHGYPERWSLTRLGWAYALLAGTVTAAAGWAVCAEGLERPLLLLPTMLPLADRDFARLFISTYSEPAGLLAAATLMLGTTVLAGTRPAHRLERALGLVLTGGGGLLASTSKLAYAPLLPIAAAVSAGTALPLPRSARRWTDRIAGCISALAVLAAAVRPALTALRWQSRYYPGVNAHNVVFTTLLPELGPGAATAVGLPPAAAAYSGRGSSDANGIPIDPQLIPGWRAAIGDEPGRAQRAAHRQLLLHPRALLRAVGVAMQATRGRDLDYLPDNPLPAGVAAARTVTATGSMGHDGAALRTWLDAMSAPYGPSLLAVLGLAAGFCSLVKRPRNDLVAALDRIAGVGAAGAVGIAALAVLGDGYYEVAKHAWLSAFLLDVTAAALLGSVLLGAARIGVATPTLATRPHGAPRLR